MGLIGKSLTQGEQGACWESGWNVYRTHGKVCVQNAAELAEVSSGAPMELAGKTPAWVPPEICWRLALLVVLHAS